MSGFKTDLSAIYRLEFYKKQKKWKLSHEEMKPKRKIANLKKSLNSTYRIDSDEKQALFNDGFLVNSDEPIQAYPDQPISEALKLTEIPANTLDSGKEIQEEMCHTQERYMWLEPERDDQMWSNAVQDQEIPVWQDAVDQDMYSVIGAGESGWCEDEDPEWSTDLPDLVQPQWIQDRKELLDQVQHWVEPNYPPDITSYVQACRQTESEQLDPGESFTEFARGAHLAPHSSEVNLALDTGNCTCDCTCSSLGRATEGELRARIDSHVTALSTLFAEILLRNSLKMSNTSTCYSRSPSHRTTLNPLPPTEGGRGRGRLRETQPLIRISMGRPYRYA